jgi:hypothetical protein
MEFSEQFRSFKLFISTCIIFLKGHNASFPKISNLSINLPFEKSCCVELVNMGGAAGIWTMHFFSTTYFDEIIIFGLSKNQTFRK